VNVEIPQQTALTGGTAGWETIFFA